MIVVLCALYDLYCVECVCRHELLEFESLLQMAVRFVGKRTHDVDTIQRILIIAVPAFILKVRCNICGKRDTPRGHWNDAGETQHRFSVSCLYHVAAPISHSRAHRPFAAM